MPRFSLAPMADPLFPLLAITDSLIEFIRDPMKRIFQTSLLAIVLLATGSARAWNYTEGDALLIFRDGSHDVEFDIGSITQFLGHTNGYTAVVTNWSLNLVTSTFGPDLTANGDGVTVLLLAASSSNSTAWLSSAEPNTTAYNPSAAGLGSIFGLVSSVGISPKTYSVPTNSTPQSLVIAVTGSGNAGKYKYASYDYVVSGGTYNAIPRLGGSAPFIVEEGIPGSLDLWAIQATGTTPQPPDHLVGTFNITADGVLTFVAGPRAAVIAGVTRNAGASTVSFSTVVGTTYSLAFTNALTGGTNSWPTDSTVVVGDGYVDTISHTNSVGAEFYRISAQ